MLSPEPNFKIPKSHILLFKTLKNLKNLFLLDYNLEFTTNFYNVIEKSILVDFDYLYTKIFKSIKT